MLRRARGSRSRADQPVDGPGARRGDLIAADLRSAADLTERARATSRDDAEAEPPKTDGSAGPAAPRTTSVPRDPPGPPPGRSRDPSMTWASFPAARATRSSSSGSGRRDRPGERGAGASRRRCPPAPRHHEGGPIAVPPLGAGGSVAWSTDQGGNARTAYGSDRPPHRRAALIALVRVGPGPAGSELVDGSRLALVAAVPTWAVRSAVAVLDRGGTAPAADVVGEAVQTLDGLRPEVGPRTAARPRVGRARPWPDGPGRTPSRALDPAVPRIPARRCPPALPVATRGRR